MLGVLQGWQVFQGIRREVFSGRLGGTATDEAVKVRRSKIAKDLISCKMNYILKCV